MCFIIRRITQFDEKGERREFIKKTPGIITSIV